ncbi:hypothetical protein JCM6882_008853 [Rhodosporidiobolus microsporus]
MPSLHDTRLLSNLLKTEKDAMQAFKHYTLTASSAGAALSAWSVADSADTGDIMDAALRISQLLTTCTDAQRSYIHALSLYRTSLKDVLARETALRTVVRDREILVNRLIKIGNKRPKDKEGAVEEHQARLEDAQRELRACETYLQEEETALAHAKRRSFRDALATRMRSMADLARVMEQSAEEAVGILETLGSGPEFDGEEFKASHHPYDLGSEAGDSIAPSQSASQAMSRASSSSSLSSLALQHQAHANAPPLPTNLHIDPRPRERSQSPAAQGRAKSPSRPSASVTAPPPNIPQMPAVPTAPPPISQTVYTERVPGLPTFEIPKAPDLSRRADLSDSDEDEGEEEEHARGGGGGGGGGAAGGRVTRSSHYPLDSPPQPAYRPSEPARLSRRKAMSETSSINDGSGGGGRKRRGSFLGGLAALFGRKGSKKEERAARSYASEPGGGGGYGGSGEGYGGARSRLASSAGGGGADDAVRRSVMNAGLRPLPRHGDSSDDDDLPRNTVRHVNDPKARLKALSDVGRPTSPPAVAKAVREKRPALQRKNTAQSRASTVRPLSPVAGAAGEGAGGGGGEGDAPKKVKRKVKKAASDIGAPTSSGWATSQPQLETRLEVPKAPTTNGLAPLAGPPPLQRQHSQQQQASPYSTAPSSTPVAASGTVTPRAAAPPAQGDSDSVTTKKKKSKKPTAGGGGGGETVVLSAEALGIPTSLATSPSAGAGTGLTRSGTVRSTATVGTLDGAGAGTIKKKKKPRATSFSASPAAAAPGSAEDPARRLPGAEDLASTLPSARSSFSPFTTQLPRPDDDPYGSKSVRPLSTAAEKQHEEHAVSRAVEAAQERKRKSSKRLSALHGVGTVGEGEIVVHHPPVVHAPVATAAHAQTHGGAHGGVNGHSRRQDVHEGDESLLSVVDRAEGGENRQTSRSYGSTAAPAVNGTSPSSNTLAVPNSTSTAASDTSSSTPAPATPQLAKRKSVRLGEVSNAAPAIATLSPSGSVRSASSATGERRGILVQRDPSPVPGSAAASLSRNGGGGDAGGGAWPTRGSIRAAMEDDTSSDEGGSDGGAGGGGGGKSSYWAARKMLGRGTREYEGALRGEDTAGGRKGKGKARAD